MLPMEDMIKYIMEIRLNGTACELNARSPLGIVLLCE